MREWRLMSLREAKVSLIDCDHRTPPASDAGYPYVAIPQLRAGRLDLTGVRRITRDHYIEWTRKAKPIAHDVILSRRCNPGETSVAPHDLEFALGQNLVLLRADGTEVYPPFLRWLVRGPGWWEQIDKFINVGAVFDSLRCADVPKFELLIPPFSEQRGIAHILGTLDDKIELNRRMNETLEAMARALFKSWFVDFEPVRAKAEGRDTGLPKEVADLFPDSFEDSELGEVPKGWRVKPLSQLCTLGRGSSPRPINDYMNGEIPWIKIADATAAAGPFLFETKEKLKSDGVSNSVKVSPGDLILSNSATCGVPIFVELHGCIHDGWLYFKDLREISKRYLYHILILMAEHLIHIADGSVQKNLNTNLVGEQLVIVPSPEIMDTFDTYAASVFDSIRSNSLESRTLATQRDTLLPKLLSGEIRVRG